METITNQIEIILISLQRTSQKLELIAMNKNHIKTENEYIDNLKQQLKEIGLKEEEQKKHFDEIKKKNNKIKKVLNLSNEDFSKLKENELKEQLNKIS